MSQSLCTRRSSFALAIALGALLVCFGGRAYAQLDLLYINANIGECPICQPDANQVLAYNLNVTTGKLTRILGPFKTGGEGVYSSTPGNEIDADQQIIVNKAGTLLFAVNGHSNTISAFTINGNGSLTAVSGSPFNSNGPQPASLGLLEDPSIGNGNSIMVVANKDNDPLQSATNPNFSTFTASSAGALSLNTTGTVVLSSGSSPSQVLVNQSGDLMFGLSYYGTGGNADLTSYRIKLDGSLSLINSLGPPNGGLYLLGGVLNPKVSAIYTGLPDQSKVGVYQYSVATGILSFTKTVSDTGKPGWMTINKAGTRLYTTENSTNSVTVYKTANALTPVQLQHLTLASGGTFGATSVVLDGTEKYLFVLTGNTLHTLNVLSDGTLSEIIAPHALPIPSGTIPTGMATVLRSQ